MKENTIYRKIVRWSAVYDVLMTSAFGIPLILSWQLDLLQGLHKTLGLGGAFPVFEPAHLLFVGLLGSIVTIWSILRIRNPEPRFGLYDSGARFLFSLHMLLALLAGSSQLIWFLFVPELLWGVVQIVGYFHLRKKAKGNPQPA
jgi:hypothetical protein